MKQKHFLFTALAVFFALQIAILASCSGDGDSGGDEITYWNLTINPNYPSDSGKTNEATIEKHSGIYDLEDSALTCEGYKLLGFTDSATADVKYSPTSRYESEEDSEIFAVWGKLTSWTITFNSNLGEGKESETKTQSVENAIINVNTNKFYGIIETDAEGQETVKNTASIKLSEQSFKNGEKFFFGFSTKQDATTAEYENGGNYTITTDVPGNVVLYAVWVDVQDERIAKITFNANDGSSAPKIITQYVKKNTAFALNDNTFTRTDYIFTGWATSETDKTHRYADKEQFPRGTSGDFTLYAVWKDTKHYYITFNWKDEKNEKKTAEQIIDIPTDGSTSVKTTIKANNVSKTGYYLIGWNKKDLWIPSDKCDYADGDKIEVSENIDLYAVWVETAYSVTVTFNGNGEKTVAEEETYSQYARSGDSSSSTFKLKDNLFTRENYIFVGWAETSSATTSKYDDGADFNSSIGITLYAVWKKSSVDVTLDANGGTGTMAAVQANYDVASDNYKCTLPQNSFTKTGEVFTGWAKTSDATQRAYTDKCDFTTKDDSTLYAVWKTASVRVTLDANGGTGTMATVQANYDVASDNYKCTLPQNSFTRDNYVFKGWFKESTTPPKDAYIYDDKDTVTTTADKTLYAVWRKVSVDVTLDANGGTGTMTNIKANYVESSKKYSYTLPQCTFTKTDYWFAGWNTKNSISSKSDLKNAGTPLTCENDTTIYAIWIPETVKISYNANGGSTVFDTTISVTPSVLSEYGEVEAALTETIPTRDNYLFFGWSEKQYADGKWTT